jgi:hypothetical protein
VVGGVISLWFWLTHPRADGITPWQRLRLRYIPSRDEAEDLLDDDLVSSNATRAATPRNTIAMLQNDRNELLLHAKAEALAAIVAAGKVSQTDGIKLVFGVGPSGSNPRYREARQALHIALERLQPGAHYPELTPEQIQTREELGLPRR